MKKIIRNTLILLVMSGVIQAQVFACNPAYVLTYTSFGSQFCYWAWVNGGLQPFYKDVTIKTYQNGCGDSYTTTTTTSGCY
jgi:hypothetical protein